MKFLAGLVLTGGMIVLLVVPFLHFSLLAILQAVGFFVVGLLGVILWVFLLIVGLSLMIETDD